MGHILRMLQEIRRRPGMYIGSPSITRLAAFMRGYAHAAETFGNQGADPFLAEFRDWIHKRFGSTRQSWEDTILQHSSDESDAMGNFGKLLDEFLALKAANGGFGHSENPKLHDV